MRFYFSAAGPTIMQAAKRFDLKRILISFYGIDPAWIRTAADDGRKVFIDSGAFSAYNSGKKVSLVSYIDFLKDHRRSHCIEAYASLDDIASWKRSVQNYEKMIAAGLDPVPCFHYGEPWELLRDYCRQTSYVAIGGIAMKTRGKEILSWLSASFRIIVEQRARAHVFGLNTLPWLTRFPAYSCDSSSSIIYGVYGMIITKSDGKWKRGMERAANVEEFYFKRYRDNNKLTDQERNGHNVLMTLEHVRAAERTWKRRGVQFLKNGRVRYGTGS